MLASTCWFYSCDVVRVAAILIIITSFKKNLFMSYKDNDFIPSIDIYSKVKNITMAIYVRRYFSAE
jgi:hypothetical protein